jgi:hypothetical protein
MSSNAIAGCSRLPKLRRRMISPPSDVPPFRTPVRKSDYLSANPIRDGEYEREKSHRDNRRNNPSDIRRYVHLGEPNSPELRKN